MKGTGVAVITPFTAEGRIDYCALEKILEYQIEGGVDFFVIMGTTAETPTLSRAEKKELLDFCLQYIHKQKPIVIGVGGNNTMALLEEMEYLQVERCEAILSVAPYYNKPTQGGMIAHFSLLADEAPVPVILYNVPARTSSNISPQTVLELSGHRNIIGIKEASGNFDQITTILQQRPSDFRVYSGDDLLALPIQALGGDGVISVAANALPMLVSRMIRRTLQEDFGAARSLHLTMADYFRMIFEEGNPAGIKASMHALGLCENVLRLPLVPASHGLYEKIKRETMKLVSLP